MARAESPTVADYGAANYTYDTTFPSVRGDSEPVAQRAPPSMSSLAAVANPASVSRGGAAAKTDVGLSNRGIVPAAGTRIRPAGIPDGWRVTGTKSPGGVLYRDPTNVGNSVRVMQGNPNSPYPNSQAPYVRWQKNGHPLDRFGNQLPSAKVPEAHLPLKDFRFLAEVFD